MLRRMSRMFCPGYCWRVTDIVGIGDFLVDWRNGKWNSLMHGPIPVVNSMCLERVAAEAWGIAALRYRTGVQPNLRRNARVKTSWFENPAPSAMSKTDSRVPMSRAAACSSRSRSMNCLGVSPSSLEK